MMNVVLTAMPTYTMCTYLLPKTVIKQVGKIRKHCLWRRTDLNSKNLAKATWTLVCVPKERGGLGVLNLYTQNESLLLKHNKLNVPWV